MYQKSQKVVFGSQKILARRFSVIIAHYCDRLCIFPNQITLFRVFILGSLSIFLFYSQSYVFNIIGLFVLLLSHFLDDVDGDLARNHDKKSELGKFLDGNLDAVLLNVIILTFVLKIFFEWDSDILVLWGFFALFGVIMSTKMTAMFQASFDIDCVEGNEKIEQHLGTQPFDRMSTFIYGLLTPKTFLLWLFSNFRYYLLVGVVFQIMPLCIGLYALAINMRWILLFISLAFFYKGLGKTRKLSLFSLFDILRK